MLLSLHAQSTLGFVIVVAQGACCMADLTPARSFVTFRGRAFAPCSLVEHGAQYEAHVKASRSRRPIKRGDAPGQGRADGGAPTA